MEKLLPILHPDCDPPRHALGAGVLLARMASRSKSVSHPPTPEAVLAWMMDHDLITARQVSRCQAAEDPLALAVSSGLASRWTIALATARLAGRACIELNPEDVDAELAHAIPEQLARRWQVLPLEQEGQSLRLAMADPSNVDAIDDVRLITGCDVEPIQASVESIQRACERTFGASAPEGTPCLLRALNVQARICGGAAEVSLEQTFVNPLEDEVDLVYSFPLPPSAVVFEFTVRTPSQTLRGQTRAVDLATEAAASEGVFSMPVGRLRCGQEATICLTYADRLEVVDGDTVFRLALPAEAPKVLRIQAILEASPVCIECSQPGTSWQGDSGSLHVELSHASALSDRDFVLRYRLPRPENGAALAVDGRHFMLTLNPSCAGLDPVPQDVVMVLDVSKPVEPRLAEARVAIARYLKLLRPSDRFRLLCVGDVVHGWSQGRWCGPEQADAAIRWLRQREPAGGLELYPVVRDLMGMPVFDHRQTSVVLVAMSPSHHQSAVASLLRDLTRPLPFFTFALDEKGNHEFLQELAALGRGAFCSVAAGDLEQAMARQWDATRRPELNRVGFGLSNMNVWTSSMSPPRIADVYHVRPAVTFGRYNGDGPVSLTGKTPLGKDWVVDVPSHPTRTRALGVLWARSRCRDLGDTAGSELVALSVQYNLLTPGTAFVLADETGRVVGRAVMPSPPIEVEPSVPSLAKVPDWSPIVSLVNALLREAMDAKATQLHLVPGDGVVRCLLRIGNQLEEGTAPAWHLYEAVVARLRQMAEMDPGETARPQQGHFPIRYNEIKSRIEVRILPTNEGEAVTLHLQTVPSIASRLCELGLDRQTRAAVGRGLSHHRGLTLVAGPYDPAVMLAYAACRELEDKTLRVVTLEACIEERLPGASQLCPSNSHRQWLEDALAQGPDVLVVTVPLTDDMVSVLLRAADTRRVIVVSKTSDASTEVLEWVRRPETRSVLRLILSGHSVPRLCVRCRESYQPGSALCKALLLPEGLKGVRGNGCLACSLSGHKSYVDWHALVVEDAVRQRLGSILVRSEMRHLLAPDWMDKARSTLENGDMDCATYGQVLSGAL